MFLLFLQHRHNPLTIIRVRKKEESHEDSLILKRIYRTIPAKSLCALLKMTSIIDDFYRINQVMRSTSDQFEVTDKKVKV